MLTQPNPIPKKRNYLRWFIIIVLIYFPLKWFVLNPLHNRLLETSIVIIEEKDFRERIKEISGYQNPDLKEFVSTYSEIHKNELFVESFSESGNFSEEEKQSLITSQFSRNLRPVKPGEVFQYRHTYEVGTSQSAKTLNSEYLLEQKGGEPIWKACLYKLVGSSYQLIKMPKNCQQGSQFNVYASNKSEYVWVHVGSGSLGYPDYPSTNYFIHDNGSIQKYVE